MIKIGLRNNLFYLLMLTIFNFLRNVDSIVMNKTIGLNSSLILTFLMFFGEFIIGLIIFIYQISFLRKKKKIDNTFMGIKLIEGSFEITYPDSDFKILFLMFVISFFDFIEFMMATLYLPQYENISNSLTKRLNGILTISSALLCYYLLKMPIFKHQIFALSMVFVCFIIILLTESYFRIIYNKGDAIYLSKVFFLIFINHFFTAFKDVIEKYLIEVDYINPFKLLMIEGLFGCILTYCYSFKEEPFSKIKKIYDENFIVLIITLFLFFFFSGGRNAYRIITNKIYSPMTRTLTDCFLDPLLITYYFLYENDFSIGDNNMYKNIYFSINLFISIIVVFFGCVYNELFILFCCDLQKNTHRYICIRASSVSNNYNYNKKRSKNKLRDNKLNDDILNIRLVSENNIMEETWLDEKLSENETSEENSSDNNTQKTF